MQQRRPPAGTAGLARAVALLLVAAACLFNLLAYQSELRVAAPDINDDVYHLGLIQAMNAAWETGGHPLDTWIGHWGQGFPVLRYYQHLPHFAVVLVYRLLGGAVPLHTLFDAFTLLLLALLPLTFYVGCRRLGASPLTAACVALCTPLLGADPSQRHFLGFQAQSFLWSGGGLFTQLAAMVLFPLALGSVSRAALEGRRYAPAIAWLGATWLSHLVLGYIACLLGLVILLRPEAAGHRRRIMLRLGAIYAGVAVVAAYLLLPTLLEGQWLARSVWEPPEYWDSYGAARVIGALVTGGVLDGHRLPVLTILAGLGAALAATAWLKRRNDAETGFAVAALCMCALGLMLYFGRPTWGRTLDLLPFSGNLPFHRFICAVQFGGLLLAGFALSRLAGLIAASWHDQRRVAAAVLVAAVILGPAVVATAAMAARNATWRAEAAEANAAARAPLDRALADFRALDATVPGRGYAGASWDWGRDFRVGGAHVYHRWTAHGLPAIGYLYHTMSRMSDLEPSFDPARRDHFELFNVRYLIADREQRLPPFATRTSSAPGWVAGLVDTEGYFGIVESAAFFPAAGVSADRLRELNRAFIASDWHAARRYIRIGWRKGDQAADGERALTAERPLTIGRPPARIAPRGTVLSSSGGGDAYQARVRLVDPGIVLFRMTYHPHWRAELNGAAVETMMLSPGYVGIQAPPGEHTVAMTYHPPQWTRVLSWAGLVFLCLVAMADRRLLTLDRRTTTMGD